MIVTQLIVLQVRTAATDEERQTEAVNRLFRILSKCYKENGNNPVCFFNFVINPKSYSLTTENMFHTSFLIREQYATITEGKLLIVLHFTANVGVCDIVSSPVWLGVSGKLFKIEYPPKNLS